MEACSSTAERYTVAVEVRQFHMVGVAQSAERLPVEEKVAGSFPVAHPRLFGCIL